MKKILSFAIFTLTINGPFIQASTGDIKKPFTGIYIGGTLGGKLLGGEHKYETPSDTGKINVRSLGAIFGGYAGYMHLMEGKTWMAGEAYLNIKTGKSSYKMKNVTDEGSVLIKNRSVFGLAVLVGGAVNPRFITYVKAAIEMGIFSFDYSNLTTTPDTKNKSAKIKGAVPGAGFLYKLSPSLLVGGEYSYMLAASALKPSTSDPIVEYKPTEHRALVTLRYVF